MEKKYYKHQSPGRTAFWFFVLSFFVILPGADYSIFESIIRSIQDDSFSGPPLIMPIPFLVSFLIFCLIFKKNHPKTVTILCNSLMIIWFAINMHEMSLVLTEFFGKLAISIATETPIGDIITTPESLNTETMQELGIKGGVSLLLFIISFRVVSRTRSSFGDVEPENDATIVAIWAIIILINISAIVINIATIIGFMGTRIEFPTAPGYIGMVSFLIFVFPAVYILKLGMSALKSVKLFRKETKKTNTLKTTLFILIFFFSWFPILAHYVDRGMNTRNHSIYNDSPWAGSSDFRDYVNETLEYDVYSIHSSLSTVIRMNKSVLLIILGPTSSYNPIAEIPFFIDMFNNPDIEFSMLISDDHGSTTTLMLEMFLGSSLSGNPIPLAIFPKGVLWENESGSYDKNPMFPIIDVSGTSHPTTSGVNKVVLSNASCILLGDIFGWTSIGTTSSSYSFIDNNGDGMYNASDTFAIPIDLPGFEGGIPLGGYPLVTFAYKELSWGDSERDRIFLTSDASMFNNELINLYDNKQFAGNIIDWLTYGKNDEFVIVFDESHNIPFGKVEFTSPAMFGLFQGYVNWLSINPFLSWIYPIWALRTLSNWIPKKDDKKKKKKKEKEDVEKEIEELKFRTSSFFAKKINWYRVNKKYNQALILLFRRVERKINKMMTGISPTVNNIIEKIQEERGKYITKENIIRMRSFLTKMLEIKGNKINIVSEEEFNDIFFQMSWIAEII